jgi:raffinose/stachyose/melibiose transport system substrate-binding protein
MRNKILILISLLVMLSMLATACGAATPQIVEKVVTQVVTEKVVETVVVEGTPQVVEKEVEVVVTATPEPEEKKEPITLTLWDFKSGEATFAPYTRIVTEQFMEKYPWVTVEVVPQPNSEYYNLVGAAIAANEGPDVMLMHGGTRLTERQDVLVPLDEYIGDEADNFINLHNGWTNTETGEIIALPVTIQGFVYYYNKNIYKEAGLDPEKPPTTWEELMANCEAIMANTDKSCFTVGGRGGEGIRFFGSLFAAAIFTPEDHARFRAGEMPYDDPKMVKQLELWYEASQRGWWQEGAASTITYFDSHDNFSAGRAAHNQGLISDVSHWRAFSNDLGANNVGMFKNVVIDPEVYDNVEDIPIAAGGGIGWAVPKWSPNRDMAVELVKDLTSREGQLLLFNSAATIIPRKDIDPDLISSPHAKQINEWLKNAEMPTFYITPTDLEGEWERQASLLLLGEATPEEATKAMVELYNSR